jgi:hypothetical protein
MLHLTHFINANGSYIANWKQLNDGFWKNRPQQVKQVIAWLSEPQIAERLEAFFAEHIEDEFADNVAVAIDHVMALRQTPEAKSIRLQ